MWSSEASTAWEIKIIRFLIIKKQEIRMNTFYKSKYRHFVNFCINRKYFENHCNFDPTSLIGSVFSFNQF